MNLISRGALVALFSAVATLASPTANANVIYSVYGFCTDCILDSPPGPPFGASFIASLTVNDSYVPGTALNFGNFVSFTYGGSNLVPGFTYSVGDAPPLIVNLLGALPPHPPPPPDGTAIPFLWGPGYGFEVNFPIGCSILLGTPPGTPPCLTPELDFKVNFGGLPPLSWRIGDPPADFGTVLAFGAVAVVVPSGVPEPATLALLGLGLSGLALTRRRRTH